jgi:hypothetical protein
MGKGGMRNYCFMVLETSYLGDEKILEIDTEGDCIHYGFL